MKMFGLTKEESSLLKKLDTPPKIQAYLDSFTINHEEEGDTCLSPRRVMRERRAHCIEGAMLAALAFRIHGQPPLVLDLTSDPRDFDHVIALFKRYGCWGAVSKSNHAVLRYREPIYRTLRELVLSYFHEYFNDDGYKTLRSYSCPVNLAQFDKQGWITSEEDVWFVERRLYDVKHYPLLNKRQIATLQKAHPMEMKAGALVEWKSPK